MVSSSPVVARRENPNETFSAVNRNFLQFALI